MTNITKPCKESTDGGGGMGAELKIKTYFQTFRMKLSVTEDTKKVR